MKIFNIYFFSLCVVYTLTGCSNTPSVQRYTLLPLMVESQSEPEHQYIESSRKDIGVGPVDLPELLKHQGLVSMEGGNVVKVSDYHLWAGGDLQDTLIRTMKSSLSTELSSKQLWSYPWDNRQRPFYQIGFSIDKFAGSLQGSVELIANWKILSEEGKVLVKSSRFVCSEVTQQETLNPYSEYVAALNRCFDRFALELADHLRDLM